MSIPAEVQRWKWPEEGWIKCNFGGAWDEMGAVEGVGMVVRNAEGNSWQLLHLSSMASLLRYWPR
ncbi:hypothetical protein C1H46_004629 [Malus baccata]|uniref:RNase H type-1 domain-containing protein n=1 Tax=Malus baccata TaxID=106549 RepID=A0A540NFN1_MALBA|nr:hypothetical protein C1H46_004629 [Malus baccata]